MGVNDAGEQLDVAIKEYNKLERRHERFIALLDEFDPGIRSEIEEILREEDEDEA